MKRTSTLSIGIHKKLKNEEIQRKPYPPTGYSLWRKILANWKCRLCSSAQSPDLVWDLVPTPYGDLFADSKEAAQSLAAVGLSLLLCGDCGLLQLAQEVDPLQIYSDYIYQTSVTVGLSEYYQRLASRLTRDLGLKVGDLVADVGSNDGTGLMPFLDAGMRVVGVEPSVGPAQSAIRSGVPTFNSFLDERTVRSIQTVHGQASLVCANAVAANVPDPVAFVRHMSDLLAPGGAISVVTGYHPDEFAVNMFDYINHDHLSYFTVTNAVRLADLCNLRLVSAERVEHKGGSVHLLFRESNSNVKPDESIAKLMQREKWLQVDSVAPYLEFSSRIDRVRGEVRKLVKPSRSRLLGIGASISTTHLLSQFDIGAHVSGLFDDDLRKVGKFSPGFGIPVRKFEDLVKQGPGSAILLSWQHTDTLLRRALAVGYHGEVIVPLPNPYVASL